jgi:hypothetical protein
MATETTSLISSLANVPQSVQNSLDAMKDLSNNLTLFSMDLGIILGYLLYILAFFVAIRGIFLAIKKYKENEKYLSSLFFMGIFHKATKEKF